MSATEAAVLLLSLKVSLVAVLLSAPAAFGCAWLLARTDMPGKAVFDGLIHLPLFLPPVVTGWALLVLFGEKGLFGAALHSWFGFTFMFRWTGAALAAGVMAFPLMVRAMRLSIEAVDPRIEQAARTLGATRLITFAEITLPLCLPGILAAAVLGLGRSLGEFGATISFVSNIPGETRTLPLAIYSALQTPGGETEVARFAAISVGLAILAMAISEGIARRTRKEAPHAPHA